MADHDQNGEHKVGTMDIRAQEKTFAAFIKLSIWVVAICFAVLIFMALANS